MATRTRTRKKVDESKLSSEIETLGRKFRVLTVDPAATASNATSDARERTPVKTNEPFPQQSAKRIPEGTASQPVIGSEPLYDRLQGKAADQPRSRPTEPHRPLVPASPTPDEVTRPEPVAHLVSERPTSTLRVPSPSPMQSRLKSESQAPSLPGASISVISSTRTRRRTSVASTSISTSAVGIAVTVRCAGIKRSDQQRCTRQVKVVLPPIRDEGSMDGLESIDDDEQPDQFCFQHRQIFLRQDGFRSRKTGHFVNFSDWIDPWLSEDTQAALRMEMEKPVSTADAPGYIYTYEIIDNSTDEVRLKVGRTTNINQRLVVWVRQCTTHTIYARGFYPPALSDSLIPPTIIPGPQGPNCHRLERLVHLVLADIALNTPYLRGSWPPKKDTSHPSTASPSLSASAIKADRIKPVCNGCGRRHKEIFTFKRWQRGPNVGREYEEIVLPVIQHWAKFIEAHL